ncbi:unnamed protein product [Leptosia nina]|uniref:Uncharacterized protein n=1 Tax=Leptosia nina TaxID=320188 RepID=A0AAV1J004_9NEOP
MHIKCGVILLIITIAHSAKRIDYDDLDENEINYVQTSLVFPDDIEDVRKYYLLAQFFDRKLIDIPVTCNRERPFKLHMEKEQRCVCLNLEEFIKVRHKKRC